LEFILGFELEILSFSNTGVPDFDRKSCNTAQEERSPLSNPRQNTSVNTLFGKVKSFARVPSFVTAAV